MEHELNGWKQYLDSDDFEYLLNYVENIKNNMPNNKVMILFGTGNNGKTTLINQISKYVGNQKFKSRYTYDFTKTEPNVIVVHFSELDKYNEYVIQNILHLIQNGQSVIIDDNTLERMNNTLLDNSKVITMKHVF
jgi:tRNA A37 threonylcarbamoyladenosine biosynthesis protein TsaE